MRACQQKPGFLSSWQGEAGILKIRSMSSSRPVTAAGQLQGGGPATHKRDTQATAGSTLSLPLYEAGPAADCNHIVHTNKGKWLWKPWRSLIFSAISTGSFTGLHDIRDITQESLNGSFENIRWSFKSLNGTCWRVHMWQVWGSGVPQHLCGGRRANCRVHYLLPPFHGFQGLNLSCRACQASVFMRWAISPVFGEIFKTQIIRMLGGAMAQQKCFCSLSASSHWLWDGWRRGGPGETHNTRKLHFIEAQSSMVWLI